MWWKRSILRSRWKDHVWVMVTRRSKLHFWVIMDEGRPPFIIDYVDVGRGAAPLGAGGGCCGGLPVQGRTRQESNCRSERVYGSTWSTFGLFKIKRDCSWPINWGMSGPWETSCRPSARWAIFSSSHGPSRSSRAAATSATRNSERWTRTRD